MRIYEFICRTPHGKEIRGECKAKNSDELARTLAATGLTLKWWKEKDTHVSHTVATHAFAKEVAGILHEMSETQNHTPSYGKKELIQNFVLFLILAGSGALLYFYLDSRIRLLEELNFQPRIMRQIKTHTAQETPAKE